VPIAVADSSESLVFDESVATSSDALLAVEPSTEGGFTPGEQVAQVTRPLYEGVTPFYVGVGGNIGIIESDESATGDFGFSVISKISLGPRFALRPSLVITENRTSLTVPSDLQLPTRFKSAASMSIPLWAQALTFPLTKKWVC
jgi:hypothetical protein